MRGQRRRLLHILPLFQGFHAFNNHAFAVVIHQLQQHGEQIAAFAALTQHDEKIARHFDVVITDFVKR